MSGRTLAERIRAARPMTACLLVSGHAADLVGGLDAASGPVTAFLAKPFSMDSLAKAVRHVLDGRPS